MAITITFHDNIREILAPRFRGLEKIHHPLNRDASIKDVIESFRVPHTEIRQLKVNGREVSFTYKVQDGDQIDVHPLRPPFDVFHPTLLRPVPLDNYRFIVDVNVARLAIFLRMLGFDTVYHNRLTDPNIAEIAQQQKRILLSKDRNLLKRKKIEFGYLVRKTKPLQQLFEVVRLFDIKEQDILPFSRCMKCNGLLHPVSKAKILSRLEPLTKKYYNTFHLCGKCDQIYWPGTHREKMEKIVKEIVAIQVGQ